MPAPNPNNHPHCGGYMTKNGTYGGNQGYRCRRCGATYIASAPKSEPLTDAERQARYRAANLDKVRARDRKRKKKDRESS